MKYTREVIGKYDKDTIRVYQAYNQQIADEAVKLQTFGENFSTKRMTWIKPSFLWMMYRSGWGTKKDQECILAIDVRRDFFDSLLSQAVLTSPDSSSFSGEEWTKRFSETSVYVQWDPDKGIKGTPIDRDAIQIGIKGESVQKYLKEGICRITDITADVKKWNTMRKNGKLSLKDLPIEKIYPITDKNIRKRLSMDV
ncbi:MAG: DUF4291 domain-containing protein [Ruminococcus sp.]|nr:DUF4291 domain-containing protein [Ruminococcus sp.]